MHKLILNCRKNRNCFALLFSFQELIEKFIQEEHKSMLAKLLLKTFNIGKYMKNLLSRITEYHL